jgi:hypothetical protein
VAGTALYDLFWNRVEYLLGLNNTWMDCKSADQRVRRNEAWGDISALCSSFNGDDDTPPGPTLAGPFTPTSPSPVPASPH